MDDLTLADDVQTWDCDGGCGMVWQDGHEPTPDPNTGEILCPRCAKLADAQSDLEDAEAEVESAEDEVNDLKAQLAEALATLRAAKAVQRRASAKVERLSSHLPK